MVRVWAGIGLGVVLFFLLMPLQAFLEGTDLSPPDNAFTHAFALVALVLLSVIAFKRPQAAGGGGNRIIKPRPGSED